MLYQEYKSKILKRVALRKAIRRFRVPIIAMLATVVILLSAFFIVKGTVGDITPGQEFNGDKIEYGKAPTFSAEAWFSDVRYEYSDAKGTAWSSKAPTHMGNYKVRAVSEGFFGERYSEEMAFSIVPRTIEVSLKDKTVVYGESPRVTASLAFKDKIICSEFVFDDTTQQQTQVQPVKGSVVILDENGNDVTGCYIINTKKENVTFTKRDITVTVESKEQVYDGTAHKHEVWQVTGGSLAYGDDVVKIVEGSFSSIIGAGSTENKGQFRVWRGDGENAVDITHHYNVTLVAGTLTITQKPIVILPSGGEYVYDGKAHYETGFTVDPSTPLVGGHTISVKDYPVITDVGEIENLLVMLIQKGDGSEVTDNYCFTYAGDYLLKVLPRELSATTESATATYDGQDHTFEGVLDIDGIADGHSIVVTNATVIKNVEKLENKLEIIIVDQNGVDVTKNYIQTLSYGNIEITKRAINIVSDSSSEIYDGQEHTAQGVGYGDGQLCPGHQIAASYGCSVRECTGPIDNVFTAVILDENGEDVTDNYETSLTYGTIEVVRRPIYIISWDVFKVYDGIAADNLGFIYQDGSYEILEGHTVKYIDAKTFVNVCWGEENEFTIEIYEGSEDKTFNYDINYVRHGSVLIAQRPISITADGYVKSYYDGQPITDLSYTIGRDGLAPEQRADVQTYAQELVNAGTWDYNIVKVTIYDKDNVDVTSNYSVYTEDSQIFIGQRPILVTSKGFSSLVYYDGEKHTEHTYSLSSLAGEPIVAGQYIKVTFLDSSYVEYATKDVDNIFNVDGIFVEGTDRDVTSNYTISSMFGVLHLEKRPVHLVSGSIPENTVVYDGYSHQLETYTDDLEKGMGIVSGQRVYLRYTGYILDAGEEENTFAVNRIIDKNGVNVTACYEFTYEYGTLRVYPRPITLTSQGATKVYNDTALRNESVIIGGMGTADWETVVFSNFAYIINAGETVNTFDYRFEYIFGGSAKASNYNVTVNFEGMLTVTKRPVTVTINNVEKVYDGTPLTPNGFVTESYSDYLTCDKGILPQHHVDMTLSGQIWRAGTEVITHNKPTVLLNDGSGDVTDNYSVAVIDGYMTVNVRDISFIGREQEKEYDAEALYPIFTNEDVGGLGIAEGDTISPTMNGYQLDVGQSTSYVESFKIFRNGEDVTDCYNLTEALDGILRVTPRKIVITILGGYKEYYDGGAVISQGYLVDRLLTDYGHTMTLEISGERIDVGTGIATLVDGSVVILDEKGRDITFNYEYTSLDGELVVEKKRPITITSATDSFIYDTKPHKNETYTIGKMGLATQREEIELVTFINGEMIDAGGYENMFEVKIFVKSTGADVTHNYEIESVFGTITIEKVKITVTTGSAEKVFDGTPLENSSADWESDNLPKGYNVSVVATGSILEAGTVKNTYRITVTDQNGTEVSLENYEIIEDLGDLVITKLRITVTSDSAEKIYDGVELRAPGYSSDWDTTEAYKKGVLNLLVTVTGKRTDIGRSDNTFIVGVYDSVGNNYAEGNCEIETVKGTLTVYADKITVTSGSTTYLYNGVKKSYTSVDHKGHIGEGHELSPTFTGEFINVGTYENQFTLDIVDKDGNSVLEFYREIEYKFGTVEITRRTIVIKPVSRKEQYTGEPLYALEEIVVPNEYLDELNGNFYGYVYTYSVDDMSDTFINLPGEELRFKIPAERFHIYLDGVALDMSNFEIISEEAYLKLAEKLVEINVFKISKSYSGKLVSYREDDWYLRDGQLPEGYTLDLKLSGGLIEAGVIDFDELLETIVALDSIHVYDENGNDVTYRYDFKFVGTPLTVTERALQITAGSASKYHDGEPLTYNEYKITGGSLARGHSIKACTVSGSITDVGTMINIISDVVIVDENGNNVTSNYDIDTVSGLLEVLENPQDNNQ